MEENKNICSICKRLLVDDSSTNYHHLIPKKFKGKITIPLHKICHDKIHSVFSERQLFNYYHTVERILENDDMKIFINWIKNKEPDFYVTHRQTNQRKKGR
jgi:hypothetical protein